MLRRFEFIQRINHALDTHNPHSSLVKTSRHQINLNLTRFGKIGGFQPYISESDIDQFTF